MRTRKLTFAQCKALAEARERGETVKVLAKRFGISPGYVSHIANQMGAKKPVTVKQRILDYARDNPSASTADIAAAVNTTRQSVRAVLYDCGWFEERGVVAIGRAAVAAGLTVKDIQALAAQRSAQ